MIFGAKWKDYSVISFGVLCCKRNRYIIHPSLKQSVCFMCCHFKETQFQYNFNSNINKLIVINKHNSSSTSAISPSNYRYDELSRLNVHSFFMLRNTFQLGKFSAILLSILESNTIGDETTTYTLAQVGVRKLCVHKPIEFQNSGTEFQIMRKLNRYSRTVESERIIIWFHESIQCVLSGRCVKLFHKIYGISVRESLVFRPVATKTILVISSEVDQLSI